MFNKYELAFILEEPKTIKFESFYKSDLINMIKILIEKNNELENKLNLFLEKEENEKSTEFYKQNQIYKKQQHNFKKFLNDMWKETEDYYYLRILNKYNEIVGDKKWPIQFQKIIVKKITLNGLTIITL